MTCSGYNKRRAPLATSQLYEVQSNAQKEAEVKNATIDEVTAAARGDREAITVAKHQRILDSNSEWTGVKVP